MTAKSNLLGLKVGRWTVVSNEGKPTGSSGRYVTARCLCGTVKSVRASHLAGGFTKSCGCLRDEHAAEHSTTHGMSNTGTYRSWSTMIQRCTNPRLKKYERYGARGIKVCDRWLKFENFFADMGRKVAGASIERQDNDGHYEPGNCVWSNPKQQARNRSTTKWVLLDGKRMTITEASVAIGLGELAVSKRLKRGWPIERALDGRGLWAAQ